jgi:hypothetical protein
VEPESSLPGVVEARRPGEERYVRFGIRGDTITARFEEDGSSEALFLLRADGSLAAVDGA